MENRNNNNNIKLSVFARWLLLSVLEPPSETLPSVDVCFWKKNKITSQGHWL